MTRWLLCAGLLLACHGLKIAPPSPWIQELRPCDQVFTATLCLQLKFADDVPPGTAYITCRAYEEDRSPPAWADQFNLTVPSSGTCDTSKIGKAPEACEVFIHSKAHDEVGAAEKPLTMGTNYFVFCSGVLVEEDLEMSRIEVAPSCGAHQQCGRAVSTSESSEVEVEFSMAMVTSCALLLVYIFWSFVFQRCAWLRFLHETGFSVIVGLLIGLFIKCQYDEYVDFNYDIFSLVVLPLVIFSAGYNLPRKSFFTYILYIVALGVGATVWIFVLIFYSTSWLSFKTLNGQGFQLSEGERLVLASVLASTDTVAPMAFLPANLFPEIYAVVFGEGVLNDVVAILLNAAATKAHAMDAQTLVAIVGQIFKLLFTSLAMGLASGLTISLLFKHIRELKSESEVLKPVAVMFLANYLCYVVSEMLELSSIFVLFFSALLCGHYAAESLGDHAKHIMGEVSELMAYLAESFVFGYFGLTTIRYLWTGLYSISFIFYCIGSIFFARFAAVVLVLLTLRLLRCGHSLSLPCNAFGIVGFAGCMRGTIAYALILKAMPRESTALSESQIIMVSTVQGVVLVNCLVFGALFPLMLCLLKVKPTGDDLNVDTLGLPKQVVSETADFSVMTDDTRGFLPRHHPLRPHNLRREVRGRWRRFDEGRMRRWLTADKPSKGLAESFQSAGPRLLGAAPASVRSKSSCDGKHVSAISEQPVEPRRMQSLNPDTDIEQ